LINKLLREVYQKKKGEVMAFDFDKLETQEGRGKFNKMMEELTLSHLNLANYLLETSFEDRIG
jgi:hypothetical protein